MTTIQLRLLSCLLVVGMFTALTSSPARAQGDAEALLREGVALRGEGRDAEALERFRRAHELAPSPRSLAQIALAEQAMGRWVDAHDHLLEALESASDPWISERRGALDAALVRIREHVGHLEVVEGVDGAEVWINGERVGALPLPYPLTVPAGTVVLEVRATGHVAFQRSIQVRAGSRARERVVLVARGAGEGGAADRVGSGSSSERPAPLATGPDALSIAGASALGAVGLAGVVAAIVGMAGAGECLMMEGATCVEERGTNWLAVGLYGGFGLASVIGAVVWLAVAVSSGGEPAPSALRLTPNGMAVAF